MSHGTSGHGCFEPSGSGGTSRKEQSRHLARHPGRHAFGAEGRRGRLCDRSGRTVPRLRTATAGTTTHRTRRNSLASTRVPRGRSARSNLTQPLQSLLCEALFWLWPPWRTRRRSGEWPGGRGRKPQESGAASASSRSKVLCPPDGARQTDAALRRGFATGHPALDGLQHLVTDLVTDPAG